MREILFRGKRTDGKGWIEGLPTYLTEYAKDMNEIDGIQCNRTRFNYDIHFETVGQFTGLTDKSGVKVFEGDILYAKYEDTQEEKGYYEVYDEVVFKNGAFGLIGETTGDLLSFDYLPIVNEVVCGNIYDNKELLK